MENEMQQEQVLQQAAQQGRGGDSVIAHLTIGEVVIPAAIAQDQDVQQTLQSIFQAYNANPAEFTVGAQENKINPETGQPEFFFKKLFKKIAPIALPILGSAIPGLGTTLGAALGGAAGGLATGGGIKGALTGAAMGGIGSALTNGFSGILGSPASTINWTSAAPGYSLGSTTTAATGLRGALSGGGLGSIASGSGGGLSNLSTLARVGGSLYGGMQEDEAAKKARNAMLGSISPYNEMGLQAQQQLSGNLSSGFNPENLANDPGYQFRLKQGQDALAASQAAQGMGQSGAALKAAQEYGQQFAANEYSNAYDRWLQQNQQLAGLGGQGLQTAAATGNVQGEYLQQQAERKNKRISEILAGLGYA